MFSNTSFGVIFLKLEFIDSMALVDYFRLMGEKFVFRLAKKNLSFSYLKK